MSVVSHIVVSISGITISKGKETQSSSGGIRNASVTLTITDSTISGNSAGAGGGIFSDTTLDGVTTTITNSTISGNTVGNGGRRRRQRRRPHRHRVLHHNQ